MRLLILGGTGFLSGTLARVGVASGHDVTVVTRGRRPAPDGVGSIVADRHDRAAFAACLAAEPGEWDLVVDAIPYDPEDARQDVDVFAGRAGLLVFVSTDFVYDPLHRSVPQMENAVSYSEDGYGGKKRAAERILEATPTSNVPWTILRPSHIYGPGSSLGCLPQHSRDPELIRRILANEPLRLIAGGRLLQHPIFAPDLAETILAATAAPDAIRKILNVAGPDIVTSADYYRVLGTLLQRDITIEEESLEAYLAGHPDKAPFCCDRVYDLTSLQDSGIPLPQTTLKQGFERMLSDP